MTVPDYQSLMAPVLHVLADGRALPISEVRERVADRVGLTAEDREVLVPSGQKLLYHDRTSWAVTYLKKAGLLARPERAVDTLTDRGRAVLEHHPERIDNTVLSQFEEFRAFQERSGGSSDGTGETEPKETDKTPEESLESAHRRVRAAVESELLEQVKSASPAFFERLVVELLVKMGYGGSLKDAGEAIGRTGDGGIDGIIKEDRLGLDVILIQAKRWTDNTVGRKEIQSFAGSLEGARGRKGIFLTTSGFSAEARRYVKNIEKRIVLIDGEQLAALMYDHGVGATTTATYDVKRLDSDFFSEE